MKKFISAVLFLVFSAAMLAADPGSVVMPGRYSSFAAMAGRYVDSFANPAALPFIKESDGSLMLSLNYSDDQNLFLYEKNEKLSFFNTSDSSLTLSFGGRNVQLTAALGFDLENRNYDEKNGNLTFDMLYKMHFQLDAAYNIGPVSGGVRLQGGSALVRDERRIDSTWDIFTNFFFSEFENKSGSEYFSIGAGLMWHEEYFTLGLYVDKLISTSGGEVNVGWKQIGDTMNIGLSVYMPRFNSRGDLHVVRPYLMLQAGDVSSDHCYTFIGGELCFQLLPDVNLSIGTSLTSYRNAEVSFSSVTNRVHDYSLELEISSFAVSFKAAVPVEYYSGDTSEAMSFTVSMRYNPQV